MREKYDGERVIVKLTEAEISQMKKGKVIEGHKASVMMEDKG